MEALQSPLNKAQIEILKLFSREVSDTDLLEVKRFIVKYFARKAIDSANKVWDDKEWGAEDEKRLLSVHERTPYFNPINKKE